MPPTNTIRDELTAALPLAANRPRLQRQIERLLGAWGRLPDERYYEVQAAELIRRAGGVMCAYHAASAVEGQCSGTV